MNWDERLKYVEWDARNWSIALDFWLANSTQKLSECRVLEIGANFGGLSLWLADNGANVVCSDFYGAKEEAINLHKAHGYSGKIEYRALNALEMTNTEEFDIIVFKSVIGLINDKDLQKKAVANMHRALKKGGELFFAENMVASPVHKFFRRKMVRWGKTWRYVTVNEMNEFLEPFSAKKLRAIGFAGTFGRSESQRNLLALGDKFLFDKIVPEKWKYIIAGVAKK